jgi:hypothetical protein
MVTALAPGMLLALILACGVVLVRGLRGLADVIRACNEGKVDLKIVEAGGLPPVRPQYRVYYFFLESSPRNRGEDFRSCATPR